MGTTVADLAVIATVAPWVSCNHEDPSPVTALGVFHAIAAAVRHALGRDLTGVQVTVQGAGHVGSSLARLLAERGAVIGVADVDARRAEAVARLFDGGSYRAEAWEVSSWRPNRRTRAQLTSSHPAHRRVSCTAVRSMSSAAG